MTANLHSVCLQPLHENSHGSPNHQSGSYQEWHHWQNTRCCPSRWDRGLLQTPQLSCKLPWGRSQVDDIQSNIKKIFFKNSVDSTILLTYIATCIAITQANASSFMSRTPETDHLLTPHRCFGASHPKEEAWAAPQLLELVADSFDRLPCSGLRRKLSTYY